MGKLVVMCWCWLCRKGKFPYSLAGCRKKKSEGRSR